MRINGLRPNDDTQQRPHSGYTVEHLKTANRVGRLLQRLDTDHGLRGMGRRLSQVERAQGRALAQRGIFMKDAPSNHDAGLPAFSVNSWGAFGALPQCQVPETRRLVRACQLPSAYAL
jgi:hypothetical protein